jgi:precorrin-2/cobalt-factor-2 C20-methyltransferase
LPAVRLTFSPRPPERTAPLLSLVGVGPGDPDLLTVAAVRALQRATVVAYPVALRGGRSMAAEIAGPWLESHQRRLPLHFPMVTEAAPRRRAWREAADRLAGEVARGRQVVLLCEGDVSLYATSAYVLRALQRHHPACPVELIPGITAVAAAAARARWPLSLQREQLLVAPVPETAAAMEERLGTARRHGQVLALLKVGARWRWLRPFLAERGLLDGAILARRVGWADELVAAAATVPAEAQPYFSLLLLRQGEAEVLP